MYLICLIRTQIEKYKKLQFVGLEGVIYAGTILMMYILMNNIQGQWLWSTVEDSGKKSRSCDNGYTLS